MNDSNESEKENMETTTRPSSLADVANAKVQKAPGTRAMGTGLETRGIHAWFGKNHVLSDIN
jgi:phosphate transport system ATP-binding protein